MKEKTKIILCITKSNWGGAQKYVYNLAISLPEKTFETIVVCGGDGELVNKLQRLNIKVIKLDSLKRDIGFKKDFQAFKELTKIFSKERPDIVHLNSSKMGLVGNLAVAYINTLLKFKAFILRQKRHTIKTVFTAHGWAFNEDRPRIQKIILKYLHEFTVSISDKTIAVAEIVKKQIVNNKNDSKIITIYNGIESIHYETKKKAREEISKKSGAKLLPKTICIGTISELHKNKGLTYIIEAFQIIKERLIGHDLKLFIIGEGEERQNLLKLISQKKLEKNIFLLGHIPNASVLLKAFDIFTLTSTTEAFPYVLLEAGLAGLPIVATSVGGIPEIIDDEINGLLTRPKNPKEIAMVVEYLLINKKNGLEFGKKIKEKITKKYSIRDCVNKTMRIYSDVNSMI